MCLAAVDWGDGRRLPGSCPPPAEVLARDRDLCRPRPWPASAVLLAACGCAEMMAAIIPCCRRLGQWRPSAEVLAAVHHGPGHRRAVSVQPEVIISPVLAVPLAKSLLPVDSCRKWPLLPEVDVPPIASSAGGRCSTNEAYPTGSGSPARGGHPADGGRTDRGGCGQPSDAMLTKG